MSQSLGNDLPEWRGVSPQFDGLVCDARRAVGAANVGETNLLPGRLVQGLDVFDQRCMPTPKRDEVNALGGKLGQICVDGEAAVEDQLFRKGVGLPVVDKAQNGIVLRLLADRGVGVAKDAGVGAALAAGTIYVIKCDPFPTQSFNQSFLKRTVPNPYSLLRRYSRL